MPRQEPLYGGGNAGGLELAVRGTAGRVEQAGCTEAPPELACDSGTGIDKPHTVPHQRADALAQELWIQPIYATATMSLSAGVVKPKALRGR